VFVLSRIHRSPAVGGSRLPLAGVTAYCVPVIPTVRFAGAAGSG